MEFNSTQAHKNTRSRAYCVTWNNPLPGDKESLLGCSKATYVVVGEEVGSEGTPHLQGRKQVKYHTREMDLNESNDSLMGALFNNDHSWSPPVTKRAKHFLVKADLEIEAKLPEHQRTNFGSELRELQPWESTFAPFGSLYDDVDFINEESEEGGHMNASTLFHEMYFGEHEDTGVSETQERLQSMDIQEQQEPELCGHFHDISDHIWGNCKCERCMCPDYRHVISFNLPIYKKNK